MGNTYGNYLTNNQNYGSNVLGGQQGQTSNMANIYSGNAAIAGGQGANSQNLAQNLNSGYNFLNTVYDPNTYLTAGLASQYTPQNVANQQLGLTSNILSQQLGGYGTTTSNAQYTPGSQLGGVAGQIAAGYMFPGA